jgi:hypothetical protein
LQYILFNDSRSYEQRRFADRNLRIMETDDKTTELPSGDESARLILDNEKPPEYTIDIEKAADPQEQSQENKGRQFLIWTTINTLATIAIVSSSHGLYRNSHRPGLYE